MHPASVLAGDDEALLAEEAHVMRERRLADAKMGEQLACAELLVLREELHNVQARGVRKRFEAARRPAAHELGAALDGAGLDTLPHIKHALDDGVDRGEKRRVALAGGILEPPILSVSCRQRGAGDAATHGNDDVDGRKFCECLGTLLRGIDAVAVAQDAQGVVVDARNRVRSS